MIYTIQYKSESLENLEKLDRQIQSRIIKKITWLAEADETTPVARSRPIESLNISPVDICSAIVSLGRRGLIERTEADDGTFLVCNRLSSSLEPICELCCGND